MERLSNELDMVPISRTLRPEDTQQATGEEQGPAVSSQGLGQMMCLGQIQLESLFLIQ